MLAVDTDAGLVQKWSDRVTHAVQADARNIDALQQIGAQDFSIAVVAVGSSIEASVLITANLVDLKIPQIWAKAISQSHGKILARIGANHVIYPEARGRRARRPPRLGPHARLHRVRRRLRARQDVPAEADPRA